MGGLLGESQSVQREIRFARPGLTPLVSLLEFEQLAFDSQFLGRRQSIDKEHAFEVVNFVLDDSGEPAFALEGLLFALQILVDDGDLDRTLDVGLDAWEGEAAFFSVFFPLFSNDPGVADHQFARAIFFAAAGVEDEQFLLNADLGGRETDAALLIHGFHHPG